MGLDVHLTYKESTRIEQPSEKYPAHLNKIGYFRSSYNSSGFDSVMRALELPTLDAIFDVGNDDYNVMVDWEQAKARAVQLLDQYLALKQSEGPWQYKATLESFFLKTKDPLPSSVAEASKHFYNELDRHTKQENNTKLPAGFRNYIRADGCYWLDGREVFAVIKGPTTFTGTDSVYIITKRQPDEWEWYQQAIEIIIETCDHVLKQSDPANYSLIWSG